MNDLGERLRRASELVSVPEEPFERLARRRDRRHRRQRVVAVAVAAAVTLGALGGGLFALTRTGQRTGVVSGRENGRLALAPGQYLYLEQIVTSQWGKVTIETWWATDGSGRTTSSCSTSDCHWGTPPDGTFGPAQFPVESDVSSLPTDPSALLETLEQRTSADGASPEPAFSPGPELAPGVTAGSLYRAIERLLEYPNATPELRAALFEVLEGLPGVQVDHDVTTDSAGRPTIALRFTGENGPLVYCFDPATKQVTGFGPPSPNDASKGFTIWNEGIVTSTDERPAGDQWLFPPGDIQAR